MRAMVLAAFMVCPAQADPLGVVELSALTPQAGLQGPVSRPDGTVLFRDDEGDVVLCDPARGPNLAEMVIELQMAQTVPMACPGLSNAARLAQVRDLRALVLPRYADRAGVDADTVRAAFLARANGEIELVTRCGVTANDIASEATDPWFETRIREAVEADRLPARACLPGF